MAGDHQHLGDVPARIHRSVCHGLLRQDSVHSRTRTRLQRNHHLDRFRLLLHLEFPDLAHAFADQIASVRSRCAEAQEHPEGRSDLRSDLTVQITYLIIISGVALVISAVLVALLNSMLRVSAFGAFVVATLHYLFLTILCWSTIAIFLSPRGKTADNSFNTSMTNREVRSSHEKHIDEICRTWSLETEDRRVKWMGSVMGMLVLLLLRIKMKEVISCLFFDLKKRGKKRWRLIDSKTSSFLILGKKGRSPLWCRSNWRSGWSPRSEKNSHYSDYLLMENVLRSWRSWYNTTNHTLGRHSSKILSIVMLLSSICRFWRSLHHAAIWITIKKTSNKKIIFNRSWNNILTLRQLCFSPFSSNFMKRIPVREMVYRTPTSASKGERYSYGRSYTRGACCKITTSSSF